MVRNAITLWALVAIVAAAMGAALLLPGSTAASSHSATRSFSTDTVAPGGEVVVTIEASGYGTFGQVVETLPEGFSYVDESVSPADLGVDANAQVLKFTLFGETSFTYTATASGTAGDYSFSGTLLDVDKNSYAVGGDTNVTVEVSEGPRASRSFSDTSVESGDEIMVTISASDYGALGQIGETLPEGFSYVAGSVSARNALASVDGQTVNFALLGDNVSFTYTVTAPDAAGSYTFSGTLRDGDKNSYAVGGSSEITVEATAGPRANRTFSPATVRPGVQLQVTIAADDYGAIGSVVETLPTGFTYVRSNLAEAAVNVAGQDVTFSLLGKDITVTYIVTASDAEGIHTFSGTLTDLEKIDYPITGDVDVRVRVRRVSPVIGTGVDSPVKAPPRFFLGVSAKFSVPENSAEGTSVGDPVQAQDGSRPITYNLVGDVPFTVDSATGQISVGADAGLDYEAPRRSYTFDVTATSEGGTRAIDITVVVTNVDEAGSIAVSPAGAPRLGATLTASLTDPDGAKNVSWQWQRSPNGLTWSNISGATDDSYTTVAADAGMRLRATATYDDALASGIAVSGSGTASVPVPPTPTPPPTATPQPTATPTPLPTATPPPPTATAVPPTPTAVPPTATAVPPTATPPPPTPTATAVPPPPPAPEPTATTAPTPRPTATAAPTATPRPPATPPPPATPTPAPTITPTLEPEEGGGFPIWAIVVIIIAALAAAGGIAFVVRQRMQQQEL